MLNGQKTRTEYLTQEKINQIREKDKHAKIYQYEYDTKLRQFTPVESETLTNKITELVNQWRKEYPGIFDVKLRLWLCGSLYDCPILEQTQLIKDLCDFRDSMAHVFLTLTDSDTPLEKIRDMKKMIQLRSWIAQGKLTEEEGYQLFNGFSQKKHLRSDITPKQMQAIADEREKALKLKREQEQKQIMELLRQNRIYEMEKAAKLKQEEEAKQKAIQEEEEAKQKANEQISPEVYKEETKQVNEDANSDLFMVMS